MHPCGRRKKGRRPDLRVAAMLLSERRVGPALIRQDQGTTWPRSRAHADAEGKRVAPEEGRHGRAAGEAST